MNLRNVLPVLQRLLYELDDAHEQDTKSCPDDDNFWISAPLRGPTVAAFRQAVKDLEEFNSDTDRFAESLDLDEDEPCVDSRLKENAQLRAIGIDAPDYGIEDTDIDEEE